MANQIEQIKSLAGQGHTLSDIAARVGVNIGDVQAVLSGAELAWQGLPGTAADTPASGPRQVLFPFAYNTPGLTEGVEIGFTPAVGDYLAMDGLIDVIEPWDGTTAKGDVGMFHGGAAGWLTIDLIPVDMTVAPAAPQSGIGSGIVAGQAGGFSLVGGFRVTEANPVKVVVSQDGTLGAADPAATQGRAVVRLYVFPAAP